MVEVSQEKFIDKVVHVTCELAEAIFQVMQTFAVVLQNQSLDRVVRIAVVSPRLLRAVQFDKKIKEIPAGEVH